MIIGAEAFRASTASGGHAAYAAARPKQRTWEQYYIYRSRYRVCGCCGKVPVIAGIPGFGPKDNMWKSGKVIHPAVDMFFLLGIFVSARLDSCLMCLHSMHVFSAFPACRSSKRKMARRVLHIIHSLWKVCLWMSETCMMTDSGESSGNYAPFIHTDWRSCAAVHTRS